MNLFIDHDGWNLLAHAAIIQARGLYELPPLLDRIFSFCPELKILREESSAEARAQQERRWESHHRMQALSKTEHT